MRVLSVDSASLEPEFGILSGRWSQYLDIEGLPFGAMWLEVPPGTHSDIDRHPEVELAIVVDGVARFEMPETGQFRDVPAGGAALLDPQERHVVHNASADVPVRLLSVYWMPATPAPADAAAPAAEVGA